MKETATQTIEKKNVPSESVHGSTNQAGRISRGRFLAGGAGLGALAALGAGAAVAQAGRTWNLDVCCDGRTFRFDNGAGPPRRGFAFIVDGKLFPEGTFAKGATGPDSAGSIGRWVCRGHFYHDLEEIAAGKTPHVATTQYYFFDDGAVLASDGLEGGPEPLLRVVTGGAGKHAGARGAVTEHEVGTNDTMIQIAPGVQIPAPNIVFAFDLLP